MIGANRIPLVARLVVVAALAVASLLTAASDVSAAGGERGAHPAGTLSATAAALATTVGVIESELTQLADGRAKLKSALSGLGACKVSPAAAEMQLDAVIANRESIAGQLASLSAPTTQSVYVEALLRSALEHSLAADRHYRSWVSFLQSRPRCSNPASADLTAAQQEDAQATAAKRTFVAAFNPLARRLHLRSWMAAQI